MNHSFDPVLRALSRKTRLRRSTHGALGAKIISVAGTN
jgi:hypothetical protein